MDIHSPQAGSPQGTGLIAVPPPACLLILADAYRQLFMIVDAAWPLPGPPLMIVRNENKKDRCFHESVYSV